MTAYTAKAVTVKLHHDIASSARYRLSDLKNDSPSRSTLNVPSRLSNRSRA
jgi:hypothetical protein